MITKEGKSAWSATVTPQEHSTIKIEGEIPYETLALYRGAALAELGKNISIDGFRKEHVPEKVLLEHVGEMTLLTEMAERALTRAYPEIVIEYKIDAIGRPQITITKLAKDNPLGFSILVTIVPPVTLPNYRKIARAIKKESAEVRDEELAETIQNLQQQKRAYERLQQKAAAKRDGGEIGPPVPAPETVSADEAEDEDEPVPAPYRSSTPYGSFASTAGSQNSSESLDEPSHGSSLTDEYVKTLGEFTSVEDFKIKLREHLSKEKAQEVAAKHRAVITDAIIDASIIDLPHILIDAEINRMFEQMEHDLTRANLAIDDYLRHIQKTREDLAKEWTPAAEKCAKLQLILNEIATQEKIEAPAAAVDIGIAQLLEHYKDADKERARFYVTSTLTNEEVLKMLEKESGA